MWVGLEKNISSLNYEPNQITHPVWIFDKLKDKCKPKSITLS